MKLLIFLLIILSFYKIESQIIKSISIQLLADKIKLKLENNQTLIGNRKLLTHYGSNSDVISKNIIYEFLGIAFAEPPLLENRFKFPKRLSKTLLTDLYDATHSRPGCMQVNNQYGQWPGTISEDCLHMNIWVPVTLEQDKILFQNNLENLTYIPNGFKLNTELKKTLFWIHGGGYTYGGSNLIDYDGTVLSSIENVIVASSNYRLGIFGFLYQNNSDIPGNSGLADQILAIEWYKEKFLDFFGSSSDICLFGESAGAMSIFNLLHTEKNYLFNKVILQSGALKASIEKTKISLDNSKRFLKSIGCENQNINCVLEKDSNYLIQKQKETGKDFFPVGFDFNGLLKTDTTSFALNTTNLRSKQFLIGFNQNEAGFFVYYAFVKYYFQPNENEFLNYDFDKTTYDNKFVFNRLKEWFKDQGSDFVNCINDLYTNKQNLYENEFYNQTLNFNLNSNSRNLAWKKFNKITSDDLFNCDAIDLAQLLQNKTKNVYFYKFNKKAVLKKQWPNWIGVTHTDEIVYVFGAPLSRPTEYTDDDRMMSLSIMNYWANFAKTGKYFSKYESKERNYFKDFNSNFVNENEQQELTRFEQNFKNVCQLKINLCPKNGIKKIALNYHILLFIIFYFFLN